MISHPEVVQVWKQVQHKMFQPLAALRCGLELRVMKEKHDPELDVMLSQIDRISTLGHFAEDLVIDAQEMKTSQDMAAVLLEAIEAAKKTCGAPEAEFATFAQPCMVLAGTGALSGTLIELLCWGLSQSEDNRLGIELHAANGLAELRINGIRLTAWQAQHAFELFTSEQRADSPELWNRSLIRVRCLFQSLNGDIQLNRAHSTEHYSLNGRLPLAAERNNR